MVEASSTRWAPLERMRGTFSAMNNRGGMSHVERHSSTHLTYRRAMSTYACDLASSGSVSPEKLLQGAEPKTTSGGGDPTKARRPPGVIRARSASSAGDFVRYSKPAHAAGSMSTPPRERK